MFKMKFRICWSLNGYDGCGEWITQEMAVNWLDYVNKKYPDMKHWIEESND